MTIEKFCLKCLREIIWDTTEHHWCCECFAVRTMPDEEGMPNLEHVPDFWIETDTIPKMVDELRALRELREVCGMWCEQLPVEVREALHAIPEIEKTHPPHNLRTELTRAAGPQIAEAREVFSNNHSEGEK